MSGEQGWRTNVDAETYFGQQQKKNDLADRRPVIRKPADLGLGPGMAANAVEITDFSDVLATYNGFFTAATGAFGAPNDDEPFIGFVVADETRGGVQRFTGLDSGVEHVRIFKRNPADPSALFWLGWEAQQAAPDIGLLSVCPVLPVPDNYLICDGSTYDEEDYPDLFVFLGTNVLPDLRDRTVYGVGSDWSEGSTDGLAYGARTKTLDHNHPLVAGTAGAHTHTTGAPDSTIERSAGAGTAAHPDHEHVTDSSGGHSHGGSTLSLAGDGPVLRGFGMYWVIRAR